LVQINKNKFDNITQNFRNKKILVLGDMMMDEYLFGGVSRISPEAPVPIINITEEEFRLGGAANVALNLSTLDCIPVLCGVVGNDQTGKNFLDLLQKNDISNDCIVIDKSRPTTRKSRIIGQSQHMLRLDKEMTAPVNNNIINEILDNLKRIINSVSAMVIQDYNKGVLTTDLIKKSIKLANKHGIPVLIDPKFKNFLEYNNVTLFKPNIKETENALALNISNDDELFKAGQYLISQLNAENVLITRGEKGMALFVRNDKETIIPTRVRQVVDVSGAGDTVIATVSACLVGGASVKESATIANYAAGIVCEEVGIVPIELYALRKAIIE